MAATAITAIAPIIIIALSEDPSSSGGGGTTLIPPMAISAALKSDSPIEPSPSMSVTMYRLGCPGDVASHLNVTLTLVASASVSYTHLTLPTKRIV